MSKYPVPVARSLDDVCRQNWPQERPQRGLRLSAVRVTSGKQVNQDNKRTRSVHHPIFSPLISRGKISATVMPPSAWTALRPNARRTRAPAMDPYDRAHAPQMAPPRATAVEKMYCPRELSALRPSWARAYARGEAYHRPAPEGLRERVPYKGSSAEDQHVDAHQVRDLCD